MVRTVRFVLVGAVVAAYFEMLLPAAAFAQMSIRRRPLGGFGAEAIAQPDRLERSGTYIPYAGGFGGYISQRALEPRIPAGIATGEGIVPRTPIGGAGSLRTPIGGASWSQGPGLRLLVGPMRGGGLIQSSPVGRPGVMPPRLASPFGRPGSLRP